MNNTLRQGTRGPAVAAITRRPSTVNEIGRYDADARELRAGTRLQAACSGPKTVASDTRVESDARVGDPAVGPSRFRDLRLSRASEFLYWQF